MATQDDLGYLKPRERILLEKQVLEVLGQTPQRELPMRELVYKLLDLRYPVKPEWVRLAYMNGWLPVTLDAMMFSEIAEIEECIQHMLGSVLEKTNDGVVFSRLKL